MKKLFLILLFVLIAGCTTTNVYNFQSCVDSGNPVMESYPRQCNADGVIYVETIPEMLTEEAVICSEESRLAEACIEIYDPVCGIREDQTNQTFSNSCFACMEEEIAYYLPGEC